VATTFKSLLRDTARQERALADLIDRYPEENLAADDKIFDRILTNDWRHQIGGFHGPFR